MKTLLYQDWDTLSRQYDWVADMADTPQDPRHHAEGNVAVHTQMVLQALVALPGYKALPQTERDILWTAALLHDVEKRSTTFTEADGSIVSPGHAKKGSRTARQLLYTGFGTPFAVREQIAGLVRYHGLPLWLMHKPDPQKYLLEASFGVNTEWLALLARADVLGRICADKEELLERIDFFEAYCREQECWGEPRVFANERARFHYFRTEHASPVYVPFDDSTCEVVLLSGLPGMGKDHYIRAHHPQLPVISLDAIRQKHKLDPKDRWANGFVAQEAKEQARVCLRAGQGFLWNATNITKQMRSQLVDLFATYKARVTIVYIERPYPVWLKQNAAREEALPRAALFKMLQKLEVPAPTEATSVIYQSD
ncbi:AAA family ATPase [Taibaiella koreensis]|uniref:AAA family ATPase n=1 Tax=Taibaiella koreensis TaxID=1268548 RepID=UPI000E5A035A|nr:AAA family ATPase [Taibaiella koreensis]